MTANLESPCNAQDHERIGRFLDAMVAAELISLAEMAVVSKLVRGYVARIYEIRADFHQGKPYARDAMSIIQSEARVAGDVIMGRDPRFAAQPWHRVGQLGSYVRSLLPQLTKESGDPGVALFLDLAMQAVKVAQHIENGGDEEFAKKELGEIVEDRIARITRTKW